MYVLNKSSYKLNPSNEKSKYAGRKKVGRDDKRAWEKRFQKQASESSLTPLLHTVYLVCKRAFYNDGGQGSKRPVVWYNYDWHMHVLAIRIIII